MPRGARLIMVALLTIVPFAGLAGNAGGQAATLSPEQPSLLWQGQPTTLGATPGPQACTQVTCESFTFELSLPEGYWEDDQGLEVSIRWTVEQNDYELFLYDEAGDQVASSTGSFSTAEGVFVPQAETGTYTAVVVPLTVVEGTYEGLAELELSQHPDGPLLPNLVSGPPTDLRVVAPVGYATGTPLEVAGQHPVSCNPDETVDAGALRCLRFSNTVLNAGDGPLEARFLTEGVVAGLADKTQQHLVQRIYHDDGAWHERLAGTYTFHEIHAHFHYEGFAQHWLYHAGNGTLARTGHKAGFCMEDVALPTWEAPGNRARSYSFPACNVPTDRTDQGSWMVQGISPGWADIYTWDLPDQYIDITGLPDGCYDLVTEADPGRTFVETTREDNVAAVRIQLDGMDVRPGGC